MKIFLKHYTINDKFLTEIIQNLKEVYLKLSIKTHRL